ncbi:MAG: ABC transporter permease subunit [Clostridia bacterium]|nr:ABC transporter permease subunit [Clostridia bacterium]
MKYKNSRTLNFFLPVLSVAGIIAIWAITAWALGKEYLLPSIRTTVYSMVELFAQAKFYYALVGTVWRTLVAFISSFGFAFLLAVISIKNNTFNRLLAPIIGVLRALPTIAVILLLIVWTKSESLSAILVTVLVILPTTYSHLKSAFEALDKSVVEASRVDGADELRVLRHIELPLIAPTALVEAGSGFSLNFKLMVAAEVLSATSRSLGNLMNLANNIGETAQLLALVIVSIVLGLVIESLFNAIAKKICDWK